MSEDEAQELVRKKKEDKQKRKVFIGGLPFKSDPDIVEEDFELCGEIDSFNMPCHKQTGKPLGIAFIIYASHEGAEKAIMIYNGKTYHGQKLRVSIADPEATGKDKRDSASDSVRVDEDKGKGKQKGKVKGKVKSKEESKGKGKEESKDKCKRQ